MYCFWKEVRKSRNQTDNKVENVKDDNGCVITDARGNRVKEKLINNQGGNANMTGFGGVQRVRSTRTLDISVVKVKKVVKALKNSKAAGVDEVVFDTIKYSEDYVLE